MPKFFLEKFFDDSFIANGESSVGEAIGEVRGWSWMVRSWRGMMIVYCRGGGGTWEFPCITTYSLSFQLFHNVLRAWNNTKPNKNKGLQAYIYILFYCSNNYYYKAG